MPEQDQRQKLVKMIRQWNDSREDLFEISQPDEVSQPMVLLTAGLAELIC